jgi:hypothetical protein
MKKAQVAKTRANTGTASALNIVPHLTCARCELSVVPVVYPRGPHLRADCPHCRCYLCFVPKRSPWLAFAKYARMPSSTLEDES